MTQIRFSASYAGLRQWKEAVDDAKECIRLDPQFMKGYYRLATAQLELEAYDMAEATIKQGLSLDANNSQLLKVLGTIKQARRTASAPAPTAVKLDAASSQELQDLQLQLSETARDYNRVDANLSKLQRERRMNQITVDELEKNPSSGAHYISSGKIFVKEERESLFHKLKHLMDEQKKNEGELSQKKEFLQRRLKSQQESVRELQASG